MSHQLLMFGGSGAAAAAIVFLLLLVEVPTPASAQVWNPDTCGITVAANTFCTSAPDTGMPVGTTCYVNTTAITGAPLPFAVPTNNDGTMPYCGGTGTGSGATFSIPAPGTATRPKNIIVMHAFSAAALQVPGVAIIEAVVTAVIDSGVTVVIGKLFPGENSQIQQATPNTIPKQQLPASSPFWFPANGLNFCSGAFAWAIFPVAPLIPTTSTITSIVIRSDYKNSLKVNAVIFDKCGAPTATPTSLATASLGMSSQVNTIDLYRVRAVVDTNDAITMPQTKLYDCAQACASSNSSCNAWLFSGTNDATASASALGTCFWLNHYWAVRYKDDVNNFIGFPRMPLIRSTTLPAALTYVASSRATNPETFSPAAGWKAMFFYRGTDEANGQIFQFRFATITEFSVGVAQAAYEDATLTAWTGGNILECGGGGFPFLGNTVGASGQCSTFAYCPSMAYVARPVTPADPDPLWTSGGVRKLIVTVPGSPARSTCYNASHSSSTVVFYKGTPAFAPTYAFAIADTSLALNVDEIRLSAAVLHGGSSSGITVSTANIVHIESITTGTNLGRVWTYSADGQLRSTTPLKWAVKDYTQRIRGAVVFCDVSTPLGYSVTADTTVTVSGSTSIACSGFASLAAIVRACDADYNCVGVTTTVSGGVETPGCTWSSMAGGTGTLSGGTLYSKMHHPSGPYPLACTFPIQGATDVNIFVSKYIANGRVSITVDGASIGSCDVSQLTTSDFGCAAFVNCYSGYVPAMATNLKVTMNVIRPFDRTCPNSSFAAVANFSSASVVQYPSPTSCITQLAPPSGCASVTGVVSSTCSRVHPELSGSTPTSGSVSACTLTSTTVPIRFDVPTASSGVISQVVTVTDFVPNARSAVGGATSVLPAASVWAIAQDGTDVLLGYLSLDMSNAAASSSATCGPVMMAPVGSKPRAPLSLCSDGSVNGVDGAQVFGIPAAYGTASKPIVAIEFRGRDVRIFAVSVVASTTACPTLISVDTSQTVDSAASVVLPYVAFTAGAMTSSVVKDWGVCVGLCSAAVSCRSTTCTVVAAGGCMCQLFGDTGGMNAFPKVVELGSGKEAVSTIKSTVYGPTDTGAPRTASSKLIDAVKGSTTSMLWSGSYSGIGFGIYRATQVNVFVQQGIVAPFTAGQQTSSTSVVVAGPGVGVKCGGSLGSSFSGAAGTDACGAMYNCPPLTFVTPTTIPLTLSLDSMAGLSSTVSTTGVKTYTSPSSCPVSPWGIITTDGHVANVLYSPVTVASTSPLGTTRLRGERLDPSLLQSHDVTNIVLDDGIRYLIRRQTAQLFSVGGMGGQGNTTVVNIAANTSAFVQTVTDTKLSYSTPKMIKAGWSGQITTPPQIGTTATGNTGPQAWICDIPEVSTFTTYFNYDAQAEDKYRCANLTTVAAAMAACLADTNCDGFTVDANENPVCLSSGFSVALAQAQTGTLTYFRRNAQQATCVFNISGVGVLSVATSTFGLESGTSSVQVMVGNTIMKRCGGAFPFLYASSARGTSACHAYRTCVEDFVIDATSTTFSNSIVTVRFPAVWAAATTVRGSCPSLYSAIVGWTPKLNWNSLLPALKALPYRRNIRTSSTADTVVKVLGATRVATMVQQDRYLCLGGCNISYALNISLDANAVGKCGGVLGFEEGLGMTGACQTYDYCGFTEFDAATATKKAASYALFTNPITTITVSMIDPTIQRSTACAPVSWSDTNLFRAVVYTDGLMVGTNAAFDTMRAFFGLRLDPTLDLPLISHTDISNLTDSRIFSLIKSQWPAFNNYTMIPNLLEVDNNNDETASGYFLPFDLPGTLEWTKSLPVQDTTGQSATANGATDITVGNVMFCVFDQQVDTVNPTCSVSVQGSWVTVKIAQTAFTAFNQYVTIFFGEEYPSFTCGGENLFYGFGGTNGKCNNYYTCYDGRAYSSQVTVTFSSAVAHPLCDQYRAAAMIATQNKDAPVVQVCNAGYEFTCTPLGSCLPIGKVCDGIFDCPDGTDEGSCSSWSYTLSFYRPTCTAMGTYATIDALVCQRFAIGIKATSFTVSSFDNCRAYNCLVFENPILEAVGDNSTLANSSVTTTGARRQAIVTTTTASPTTTASASAVTTSAAPSSSGTTSRVDTFDLYIKATDPDAFRYCADALHCSNNGHVLSTKPPCICICDEQFVGARCESRRDISLIQTLYVVFPPNTVMNSSTGNIVAELIGTQLDPTITAAVTTLRTSTLSTALAVAFTDLTTGADVTTEQAPGILRRDVATSLLSYMSLMQAIDITATSIVGNSQLLNCKIVNASGNTNNDTSLTTTTSSPSAGAAVGGNCVLPTGMNDTKSVTIVVSAIDITDPSQYVIIRLQSVQDPTKVQTVTCASTDFVRSTNPLLTGSCAISQKCVKNFNHADASLTTVEVSPNINPNNQRCQVDYAVTMTVQVDGFVNLPDNNADLTVKYSVSYAGIWGLLAVLLCVLGGLGVIHFFVWAFWMRHRFDNVRLVGPITAVLTFLFFFCAVVSYALYLNSATTSNSHMILVEEYRDKHCGSSEFSFIPNRLSYGPITGSCQLLNVLGTTQGVSYVAVTSPNGTNDRYYVKAGGTASECEQAPWVTIPARTCMEQAVLFPNKFPNDRLFMSLMALPTVMGQTRVAGLGKYNSQPSVKSPATIQQLQSTETFDGVPGYLRFVANGQSYVRYSVGKNTSLHFCAHNDSLPLVVTAAPSIRRFVELDSKPSLQLHQAMIASNGIGGSSAAVVSSSSLSTVHRRASSSSTPIVFPAEDDHHRHFEGQVVVSAGQKYNASIATIVRFTSTFWTVANVLFPAAAVTLNSIPFVSDDYRYDSTKYTNVGYFFNNYQLPTARTDAKANVDAMRIAGIKDTVFDLGKHKGKFTLTFWMNADATTRGIAFAVIDNWQASRTLSIPVLSTLLAWIENGADTNPWFSADWGLYGGIYVDGGANALHFIYAAPGGVVQNLKWDIALINMKRMFDGKWHFLALDFFQTTSGYVAQLFVDGETSYTGEGWRRCLYEQIVPIPTLVPGQVINVMNARQEVVKPGGLLVLGHANLGLFDVQVYPESLTQDRIVALGAQGMELFATVLTTPSLILGVMLIILAFAIVLVSLKQLYDYFLGGERDARKTEEEAAEAAVVTSNSAGSAAVSTSTAGMSLLIQFLTVVIGVGQSMAMYFGGWSWPDAFKNIFQAIFDAVSFDWLSFLPKLPTLLLPGIEIAVAMVCFFGIVLFATRDEDLFAEVVSAFNNLHRVKDTALTRRLELDRPKPVYHWVVYDDENDPIQIEPEQEEFIERSLHDLLTMTQRKATNVRLHSKTMLKFPGVGDGIMLYERRDGQIGIFFRITSDELTEATQFDDLANAGESQSLEASESLGKSTRRHTKGPIGIDGKPIQTKKVIDLTQLTLECVTDNVSCPLHKRRLIRSDTEGISCVHSDNPYYRSVRCQPGITMYQCPAEDCMYAVCEDCYNGGAVDAALTGALSALTEIRKKGVWRALSTLVVLGCSLLYLPVLKNSMMVVFCHPLYQCQFESCWSNPSLLYILSVLVAFVAILFIGLGLIIAETLLLWRRKANITPVLTMHPIRRKHCNFACLPTEHPTRAHFDVFLSVDTSMLKSLYEPFDFVFFFTAPVQLLFKAVQVICLVYAVPNSLTQLVLVSACEVGYAGFLLLISPYKNFWIEILARLSSIHNLLQLGLSALNRVDVKINPNGTGYQNQMILVSAIYFACVGLIILGVFVGPIIQERFCGDGFSLEMDDEEARQLKKELAEARKKNEQAAKDLELADLRELERQAQENEAKSDAQALREFQKQQSAAAEAFSKKA